MKLSELEESEVLQVYDAWLHSYLTGDVETYDSYLDPAYHFIGSTNNEEFLSRKDTTAFFKDTAEQFAGKTELRNESKILEKFGELVFITHVFDAWFLSEKQWTYYGRFRFTSALHKTKEGWRFIYQHFSVPDSKAQEGETIGYNQISAENLQLREAIKRRTFELENRNRDLEIERSMERIRTVSMSMQNSSDLAKITEVVFKELKNLGLADLRNSEIVISHEGKDSMTSYYYSDDGVTGVIEIDTKGNPILEKWASEMNKADDAFAEVFISEKEMNEWRTYRDSLGYAPDPKLKKAKSLYYYSYSIGLGALSISSFGMLAPEQLKILQRFRNVFNLSYQRYMDIEQAEAQTREAQIELSLERIRARTMAMQKSEELKEVVKVIFDQLAHLGINAEHAGIVVDYEPEKDWHFWIAETQDIPAKVSVPYLDLVWDRQFTEAKKEGRPFFTTQLDFEEKNNFYKELLPHIDGLTKKARDFYFNCPGLAASTVIQKDIGLYIENFSGTPYSGEENDILMRFGKVFQQTYTRFLDLQKAEAQARESEIELALERVRARTMAMRSSDELIDVATVLFQQVKGMGVPQWNCGFNIWDIGDTEFTYFPGSPDGIISTSPYKIPLNEHPIFQRFDESRKRGDELLIYEKEGEIQADHYRYMLNLPGTGDLLLRMLETGFELPPFQIDHLANFAYGNLIFITYEHFPEMHDVFKRFAKVFEQTYTRFLDLQKAEAQAREAQIEAALERVRSRTMAMHKSEELSVAASVLLEQVKQLGIPIIAAAFVVFDEKEKTGETFLGTEVKVMTESFNFQLDKDPTFNNFYDSWKVGDRYAIAALKGKELKGHLQFVAEHFPVHEFMEASGVIAPEEMYIYAIFYKNGMLGFNSVTLLEQNVETFIRFAKVFEQTYTRFLDLQKAEAQAREAQIEAAMERIRSRALAMRGSEEIMEVITELRRQIDSLGQLDLEASVVHLYTEGADTFESIAAVRPPGESGEIVLANVSFPVNATDQIGHMIAMYGSKETEYTIEFTKTMAEEWQQVMLRHAPMIAERREGFVDDRRLSDRSEYWNFADFSEGSLLLVTHSPASEDTKEVLRKASQVFDLAYRRYRDLQKAEKRAMEAQIEVSLERIRAKAMAMQTSKELMGVADTIREQMRLLEQPELESSMVLLYDEKKFTEEDWFAFLPPKNSGKKILLGSITWRLDENEVVKKLFKIFKSGASEFTFDVKGKDLEELFKDITEKYPAVIEYYEGEFPENIIHHVTRFSGGHILMTSHETPNAKSKELQKRITDTFDLAYKRFLDLQKAEEQAREAQVEAALERVRSRTLAMQKSDELAETAAVLFKQLIHLGIAPNRLFIGIIKDKSGDIEAWATNEDGSKVETRFILNAQNNESVKKMYEGWKEQRTALTIDMQGTELENYFKYLGAEIQVPFKGGLGQKRRVQNIAYFGKGFIGMASPEPQPKETTQLLERFAAVFNLTYTRFNDLKIAEAHAVQAELDLIKLKAAKKRAEEALAQLRSTQSQLIQSEKMASLGELTAGIAHEIQNPLNFVNNFSEVSNELIDEMNEEMEKGDIGEAREIAADIKQNLLKINHHGKRADAIVKGMLQHSRSSSGTKEPTDINALCDEYLRLAYHGLRAKDKGFNATMETEFDTAIGNVNIVPQDMGRVILNLITNAFYAISERKRQGSKNYVPMVWVSTKKDKDQITISVRDNGNGIPQKVLDKIFQPFFTTKPTGQGTGLGLSMSYDIVKAHGGELTVKTQEGKGSVFVIQLPIKTKP